MSRLRLAVLALSALLLGSLEGCSHYELQPPGDFCTVEQGGYGSYQQRSATADGVVLGLRWVKTDEQRGSNEFWRDAVTRRLRLGGGYALLEETPYVAASGQEGVQLRFGRDTDNKSYLYWVTLVQPTDDSLFVLEAGGEQEAFAARQSGIEEAMRGFDISWWIDWVD